VFFGLFGHENGSNGSRETGAEPNVCADAVWKFEKFKWTRRNGRLESRRALRVVLKGRKIIYRVVGQTRCGSQHKSVRLIVPYILVTAYRNN